MNITELKQKIMLKSFNCGISSPEVAEVKLLVENKSKNNNKFVCEGLWAVEKLIEKKIKVTEFFFNIDKINSENIDEKSIEKIAKMLNYSQKNYAISEKSCKKISDRDGYDEFFIIAEQPQYTLSDFEKMFVYLDNSATTKVKTSVAETMVNAMTKDFGNPSSLHRLGFSAEKILKESQKCKIRKTGDL